MTHCTLHPVVLTVPGEAASLPPPAKVKFLSQHARKALALSAEKSAMQLGRLRKAKDGRPLPSNGVHWSLSHKPRCVAAVVADRPIGIDLEPLEERRNAALLDKVARPEEWRLVPEKSWYFFYRFWTAKEAVLKAGGTGLKDLSKCRIHEVKNKFALVAHFKGCLWQVEHVYFEAHIVSVVRGDCRVDWNLIGH